MPHQEVDLVHNGEVCCYLKQVQHLQLYEVIRVLQVSLERVRHQHEHFLLLIEKKHQRKVADALLGILRSGDQL